MSTTATLPADPIRLVRDLDADAIAARLVELEAEASALRVLLRSARARENARKRASRPTREKEVAHASP
jgi:hypothetical protein